MGAKQTSRRKAATSVFDPYRKSCRLPVLASSATPEPKILACNATQTRTHIPDRATVISIRKYTDARRNTGPRTQVWPSDSSRTGQLCAHDLASKRSVIPFTMEVHHAFILRRMAAHCYSAI